MFNLSQIVESNTLKDWEVISPVDNSHEATVALIGPRIGRSIHGNLFHYVTGGQYDEDGKLWISSYYAQMQRLNSSLEVEFTPNIAYQAPSSGEGTAYLQDMSLTTDGSKLLLAVSYAHHCVKIYDRDAGTLISTIGIPNGSGNIADGRLRNPHSAIRLTNGNIVVSSYNGFGSNSTNHGSISEWDVSTPIATLVATRMEFLTGTSGVGNNIVYRPMRIFIDKDDTNILWISEYGRGKILKVNMTTWLTEEVFTHPIGVSTIASSYGLCQMVDGTIVAASNSAKRIVGINPTNHEMVFDIDTTNYGASANGMRGVFEFSPGYIAWADWTTQLIYISKVANVDVQYQTPSIIDGWEVEQSLFPESMDANYVMSVKDHEITSKVQPVAIMSRKP